MNFEIREVENLMLNMSAGLLPKDLSEHEVNMLIEECGKDWFYELGYDDSYEKPKF